MSQLISLDQSVPKSIGCTLSRKHSYVVRGNVLKFIQKYLENKDFFKKQ